MKYTPFEHDGASPIHWGVILPTFGSDANGKGIRDAAAAAEGAGYDSCWVTDHVVVDSATSKVYGSTSEALVTAAWVLGQTKRIGVGVSALIVPQRPRVLTLKQVATLSMLAQGRFILAVAAGWLAAEFRALGALDAFYSRGVELDRWLSMAQQSAGRLEGPMTGLLGDEDMWMGPDFHDGRPPPIWIAGRVERVLQRAAAHGTWHPSALRLREFSRLARAFRTKCRDTGRIVMRVSIGYSDAAVPRARDERGHPAIVGPPEWIERALYAYCSAGADGFTLNFMGDRSGVPDAISRFAADVVPRMRNPIRRA